MYADILEGVNDQPVNQISGHTNPGCVIGGQQSAAALYQNTCYQADNSGCYFRAHGTHSYGAGFNSIGGGVYAMQWTSKWISIWHFRRDAIPANIVDNSPDPATWGRPMAMFKGASGSCDITQHFNSMKIVLNTDFCGGWAQSQWGSWYVPIVSLTRFLKPFTNALNATAQEQAASTTLPPIQAPLQTPSGKVSSAVMPHPQKTQADHPVAAVNSIKVFHSTVFRANAAVSGNDTAPDAATAPSTPQRTIVPLASILPDYHAPADAMGAASPPVVGPAPSITTFLPLTGEPTVAASSSV